MNRSLRKIPSFPPYFAAETYVPKKVQKSDCRWFAWSFVFGAVVILGGVLFGFLMRDGRILVSSGSVMQPGTQQNPVSSGGKCTIESLEKDTDGTYFHCRSIWTLQNVLRGNDAYDFLSTQMENLPKPEAGKEYLVLRFSVTLLNSSGRGEVHFSTRYFDAVGKENTVQWVNGTPEDFLPAALEQPVNGYLALQVSTGDVPLIFYQAAKDKYYYFKAE